MAYLEINGMDALMDDFSALAHLPYEVVEDILNAEADVIVPAQRAEIKKQWNGLYSKGISAKSIKKTDVKIKKSGYCIYVYPQGTRKRGRKRIRNGEIAFINEYGVPGRGIAPRPAIGTANAKAEKQAVEAGEKVYHAYLDSKNL